MIVQFLAQFIQITKNTDLMKYDSLLLRNVGLCH